MMANVHWTQTEAGKRKMSQIQKQAWIGRTKSDIAAGQRTSVAKPVTITANGWTVTLGETVQVSRTERP